MIPRIMCFMGILVVMVICNSFVNCFKTPIAGDPIVGFKGRLIVYILY